jgi:hypothetical protein
MAFFAPSEGNATLRFESVPLRSEWREETFRVFAVSKSILAWRGSQPAQADEILAAKARRHDTTRHDATRRHYHARSNGKELERAVRMAFNEVVVITTGIPRSYKTLIRGLAFPSATCRSTTAALNGTPSSRALCAKAMELANLTAAPAS